MHPIRSRLIAATDGLGIICDCGHKSSSLNSRCPWCRPESYARVGLPDQVPVCLIAFVTRDLKPQRVRRNLVYGECGTVYEVPLRPGATLRDRAPVSVPDPVKIQFYMASVNRPVKTPV